MKSNVKYVGKCLLLTSGKENALVVGDLHLGFEQSLNESGILISRGMFEELIKDFDKIFSKIDCKIDKIILLGDVKHDFGQISRQEWNDLLKLFDYLIPKCKNLIVIKGNHDNMLEPVTRKRDLKLRDMYCWKEFCFTHGDEDYEKLWGEKVETIIVGHGHPAIRLTDGGRSEKYKCFLSGKLKNKKLVVVPSFSEWYAGSDPREGDVVLAWDINFDNFEVRVVSDNLDVLDFGKLKKID